MMLMEIFSLKMLTLLICWA